MMKVAVIGSGGREHVIIKKLKENTDISELYAIPGNGGISADAVCVNIKASDVEAVSEWCAQKQMDYVVVAPDDPLALGLVDKLADKGIKAFGPTAKAAQIEASKVFAKELMKKYHIPTAGYAVFDDATQALDYIKEKKTYPVVVKADGLALGKGVFICNNEIEAAGALSSILEDKKFGENNNQVVIEEFLQGPEVSILAFCDGKHIVPMISSMDHKRALNDDQGANTGGMGCIAPNPFYTPEIADTCMREIFMPTMEAMEKEGAPFKGCLYFGLMLTKNGPKVIEYNARFGDPEAQVVLPLLKTDLLNIMLDCTNGCLKSEDVVFKQEAACCVIMASGGYPASYDNGKKIVGIDKAGTENSVEIYIAGAKLVADDLVTAGGRVLGITAIANTLPEAIQKAYNAVSDIHFDNAHYRTDIGKNALKGLL